MPQKSFEPLIIGKSTNKNWNFKENHQDCVESVKTLSQNTNEILWLKRKLAEKNEEISKLSKNAEDFRRVSGEKDDRILSLEISERGMQQKIEFMQENQKKVSLKIFLSLKFFSWKEKPKNMKNKFE